MMSSFRSAAAPDFMSAPMFSVLTQMMSGAAPVLWAARNLAMSSEKTCGSTLTLMVGFAFSNESIMFFSATSRPDVLAGSRNVHMVTTVCAYALDAATANAVANAARHTTWRSMDTTGMASSSWSWLRS